MVTSVDDVAQHAMEVDATTIVAGKNTSTAAASPDSDSEVEVFTVRAGCAGSNGPEGIIEDGGLMDDDLEDDNDDDGVQAEELDAPAAVDVEPPADFDVDEFVECVRYDEEDELRAMLGLVDGESPLPVDICRRAVLSRASSGNTALHMCSGNNNVTILEFLLSFLQPGDVNVSNHCGSTALHYAALNGHSDICERLMRAGARADVKDHAGHSALFLAEQQGHSKVVDRILACYNTADK